MDPYLPAAYRAGSSQDEVLEGHLTQKKLPPEYMKALLSFRYMLDQASKGPILNLKNGVPVSPPFRSLFVREPQVPGSTMIRVQTKRWRRNRSYVMDLSNAIE
jgi:hypothetical protein